MLLLLLRGAHKINDDAAARALNDVMIHNFRAAAGTKKAQFSRKFAGADRENAIAAGIVAFREMRP